RLFIHDSGPQVTPLLIVSFGSGALGTQSTWYACTNARSGEGGSSALVAQSRTPLAIGASVGSLHSTTLFACDVGRERTAMTSLPDKPGSMCRASRAMPSSESHRT